MPKDESRRVRRTRPLLESLGLYNNLEEPPKVADHYILIGAQTQEAVAISLTPGVIVYTIQDRATTARPIDHGRWLSPRPQHLALSRPLLALTLHAILVAPRALAGEQAERSLSCLSATETARPAMTIAIVTATARKLHRVILKSPECRRPVRLLARRKYAQLAAFGC